MKKILFLVLLAFLLVSCGKSAEPTEQEPIDFQAEDVYIPQTVEPPAQKIIKVNIYYQKDEDLETLIGKYFPLPENETVSATLYTDGDSTWTTPIKGNNLSFFYPEQALAAGLTDSKIYELLSSEEILFDYYWEPIQTESVSGCIQSQVEINQGYEQEPSNKVRFFWENTANDCFDSMNSIDLYVTAKLKNCKVESAGGYSCDNGKTRLKVQDDLLTFTIAGPVYEQDVHALRSILTFELADTDVLPTTISGDTYYEIPIIYVIPKE